MVSLLLAKDVRPPPTPPDSTLKKNKQVYGYIFSNDESVVHLVSQVMPLVASFQVADGLAGSCGGVLRGQGRQHLGAAFNLVAYYVLALPLGIALAFHWGYGLPGLWIGTYTLLFSFSPFHGMHDRTFTLTPLTTITYRPGGGAFYRGYVRVCGCVAWHRLGSRSREGGLA